jgi:hypothetical protein
MFRWLAQKISNSIIRYLEEPVRKYEPFAITDSQTLERCLRPGDILLVEGNKRISGIIKYLTQSTWSHAAFYVGDALRTTSEGGKALTFIEANAQGGVTAVPLSAYAKFNTRICRPVELSDSDRTKVIDFMVSSLGMHYDTKNIIDLLRYLLPYPPVPIRYRRRMLALGSGDPTKAICSSLIAQAYQKVRYPILPHIRTGKAEGDGAKFTMNEILHIRHHTLFTPRDFDISPYFMVIKPTIEQGFDYQHLVWAEEGRSSAA